MWRKAATSSNDLVEDDTTPTAFERYYKNTKIESLQDCAAEAPPIIAPEFEARFFAEKPTEPSLTRVMTRARSASFSSPSRAFDG